MDISTVIRRTLATMTRRPAELFPVYVLGTAVPSIARTAVFLGIFGSYLYLETTDRLEELRESIAAGEIEPPPDGGEEAIAAWMDEIAPQFEALVSPVVGITLFGSFLVGIGIFVVLYVAVAAARIGTCNARLDDDPGVEAGMAAGRRFWPAFLGLFVLEASVWIGLLVGGGLVIAVAVAAGPLGVIVSLPSIAGLLVSLAAVRLLFAFAPIAVVVDGTSSADGVRAAGRFLRGQPIEAFLYGVVSVLTIAGVGVLGIVFSLGGAGSVVALVGIFFLGPFLDLLKTGLYRTANGGIDPVSFAEESLVQRVFAGIRRGWREMLAFVRENPIAHAVSLLALLVGFWAGYVAAGPFLGIATTSIAERTDDLVFGVAALDFFANNWAVTLSMAFSGLVVSVPAIASLWFNGFVFGVVGRLEVTPIELVAFVLPHGIFEIPAIIIAGAVGIQLGTVGWRALRGRAGNAAVSDAVRRAFWVLVGVGVLLAVAGVIEGVISPYYYQPFV